MRIHHLLTAPCLVAIAGCIMPDSPTVAPSKASPLQSPVAVTAKIHTDVASESRRAKADFQLQHNQHIYADATFALGQAHAMYSVLSSSFPDRGDVTDKQFLAGVAKTDKVSKRRLNEILALGAKQNWPSKFDEGNSLETNGLRASGVKVPDD